MNSVASEVLLDEFIESESFLPIVFESADDTREDLNEDIKVEKCLEISSIRDLKKK